MDPIWYFLSDHIPRFSCYGLHYGKKNQYRVYVKTACIREGSVLLEDLRVVSLRRASVVTHVALLDWPRLRPVAIV